MDRLLELYKARFGQAVRRQGNGWNGPCPICGGEPGKSDRFMVWPDRDDHLGELCSEHKIRGIWSCRQCGASGDTIAYLVKCDGLDFKAALGELGIEGGRKVYRRRRAPAEPRPAGSSFEPKDSGKPSPTWREAAMKLVDSGMRHLPDNPQAMRWLEARGIGVEAAARYRLGWLPPESEKYQGRFRPRASFGLDPKVDSEGKTRTKLFIPRGIVVPSFDAAGQLLNVRVRRHKEDLTGRAPKYMELEGSARGPLVLAGSSPRHLACWVIVEAELDAMLIHHASAGVVGAIAARTNRGKPDAKTHALLRDAARILVALDYDEAGAEGVDFWLETYRVARRWPTPDGKDPGDAYALGVDIRAWISEGLPGCVSLPDIGQDESPELHGSNITRQSLAAQEFAGNGPLGTSASGQNNWGGGAAPNSEESLAVNVDSHAGQGDMPESLSQERADMPQAGPKEAFWASKSDFNAYELEALRGALESVHMALDEVPLDIARFWLVWHHIPAVWKRCEDRFDRVVPYEQCPMTTICELDAALWDYPCARTWLDNHPADVVSPQNFFRTL